MDAAEDEDDAGVTAIARMLLRNRQAKNVLYVIASKEAVVNGSNRANDNARSTSQISHIGIREGFDSLLLWKTLHSLISIPNCAGVNICLGARADRIAALYALTVEAAKVCDSNR